MGTTAVLALFIAWAQVAPSAPAAGDVVADQWLEYRQRDWKIAWGHVVVCDRGGQQRDRFEVSSTWWTPCEEGVVIRTDRRLADGEGRVLAQEIALEGPYFEGPVRVTARRDDDGSFRWRVEGPAGSTREESRRGVTIMSTEVLTILEARGELLRPVNEVDEFGLLGLSHFRFALEADSGGLRGEMWRGGLRGDVTWFEANGTVIRSEGADEVTVVRVSEAEAWDRSRCLGRETPPIVDEAHGIAVSVPGPGWKYVHDQIGVALHHVTGLSLFVFPRVPGYLPNDPAAARALAAEAARTMAQASSTGSRHVETGDVRPGAAGTDEVATFDVQIHGPVFEERGTARLLRGGPRGDLLLADSGPVTIPDAQRARLSAAAREGVVVLEHGEILWTERVAGDTRVSLRMPESWVEGPPAIYFSPTGRSTVAVGSVATTPEDAAQRILVLRARMSQSRPILEEGDVRVDGRPGRRFVVEDVFAFPNNVFARSRLIHVCVYADGRLTIIRGGYDLQTGEPEVVDTVMASVRFVD